MRLLLTRERPLGISALPDARIGSIHAASVHPTKAITSKSLIPPCPFARPEHTAHFVFSVSVPRCFSSSPLYHSVHFFRPSARPTWGS
jgi:hypothetical protein